MFNVANVSMKEAVKIYQVSRPTFTKALKSGKVSGVQDDSGTVWPVPGLKKPNAIMRNDETEKWLLLRGTPLLVERGKAPRGSERC